MNSKYTDFLQSKVVKSEDKGLSGNYKLNKILFPFQTDIVKWALKKGKACIFADCGLGKSFMQLET